MKKKLVILSGAGISAESGIKTFRDSEDGLWHNHNLEDVSIKTSIFKLIWLEGPLGLTAETSFGRCHISKIYKELTVISPTGTSVIWKSVKDIQTLKQKAQELHERTISKSQMYIHNQIKVK